MGGMDREICARNLMKPPVHYPTHLIVPLSLHPTSFYLTSWNSVLDGLWKTSAPYPHGIWCIPMETSELLYTTATVMPEALEYKIKLEMQADDTPCGEKIAVRLLAAECLAVVNTGLSWRKFSRITTGNDRGWNISSHVTLPWW